MVKITNATKILLILSRSFRWETGHCSADIQGPLSVNLPELPMRNSEEFEVGNGKLPTQEGTNVYFSNVHFVLCQILALTTSHTPLPCLLSPPPPLYCFHTKWTKVSDHEPQEGSSNAEMSRRTKCTFAMCTFVTPWPTSQNIPSIFYSVE